MMPGRRDGCTRRVRAAKRVNHCRGSHGTIPVDAEGTLRWIEELERQREDGETTTMVLEIPTSVYPVEFLGWEALTALGSHIATLIQTSKTPEG